MSLNSRPQPAHNSVLLPTSTFGRTIADLSKKHHLRCSVRLLPKQRAAYAEVVANRRRINVTPAVLEESEEEQAWTAAHEFGHLISARDRGQAFNPWGFFIWLVVVVVLASPLPIIAFVMLQPVIATISITSRIGTLLAICITCWAAAAVCGHLALLRLARHKLVLEREADLFAQREGYPITPAIVAMLRRHEGPIPLHSWRARYRHHPLPEDRLNQTS